MLLEEKNDLISARNYVPPAFDQERCSISFDLGGETDSPEQEAGRERFNYAFYAFTHSDSESKPLRSGHPDSANVLEQEKYQRTDRKMGLQAKERRAGGTVAPLVCLHLSVGCPFPGDI